jgi:CRP/FNR family cyclic AMP-dependent transcriptional regulator
LYHARLLCLGRKRAVSKHPDGTIVPLNTGNIGKELQDVEVLRSLPQPVVTGLLQYCRVLSVPKDGAFFTPGDPPSVYVLVRGRVTILARPSPETEIELSTHRAHELFGELSLPLGRHVNEARALVPAVAIRIEGGALWPPLAEGAPAARALAQLLAERTAAGIARLGEIAMPGVKDRLCLLVERLAADTRTVDSDGCHLPDGLTRDHLARMVGASREAVSRGLSRLQREGKVILRGRRIIVPPNGSATRRAG